MSLNMELGRNCAQQVIMRQEGPQHCFSHPATFTESSEHTEDTKPGVNPRENHANSCWLRMISPRDSQAFGQLGLKWVHLLPFFLSLDLSLSGLVQLFWPRYIMTQVIHSQLPFTQLTKCIQSLLDSKHMLDRKIPLQWEPCGLVSSEITLLIPGLFRIETQCQSSIFFFFFFLVKGLLGIQL